MEFIQITENKRKYDELLLLADENEDMVKGYLEQGEMFALNDKGVKCIAVVVPVNKLACELKNIATEPTHQNKGYGKAMVSYLFTRFESRYANMFVGTGESDKTIGFYQSCGFEISHRVKDFFTRFYPQPIFDEGIFLQDMIYLRKTLAQNNAYIGVLTQRQEHAEELLNIWESAVRQTHTFLSAQDIARLKPLVLEGILTVEHLICYREHGKIEGFLGVEGDKIEMLFIDAASRGKGIGKAFIGFALKLLRAHKVDVNEQNCQGVGFYEHMNFKRIGRSEKDGQGNPFPLLHMAMENDG